MIHGHFVDYATAMRREDSLIGTGDDQIADDRTRLQLNLMIDHVDVLAVIDQSQREELLRVEGNERLRR